MNQLYPIVRRVRRPLLPVEDPPNEGGSKKAEGAAPAPGPPKQIGTDRRAVRAALGGKADETSAVRSARSAIAPHPEPPCR